MVLSKEMWLTIVFRIAIVPPEQSCNILSSHKRKKLNRREQTNNNKKREEKKQREYETKCDNKNGFVLLTYFRAKCE